MRPSSVWNKNSVLGLNCPSGRGSQGCGAESPRISPWTEAAFVDNDKSSGLEMKPRDLKSMSVEELWSLHELVSAALARKIKSETEKLDQRLRQLALLHNGDKISHARRAHPQV